MRAPFQFGKVVEGNSFADRNKEMTRLTGNFENRVHTILISPRRWGKSSLVKKAAKQAADRNANMRFAFIDLFNIRNEEEFYTEFARQVIRSTANKVEEWIDTAKTFFNRITPRFSFGTDPLNDFEVSFDMKDLLESFDEILNLPEMIAVQKKITMVVCIDEFQNLSNFNDPELFQKRLRAIFQHHQNVSYCFYGSRRHMLSDIFENQSMPFYRFGDVLYLGKIPADELTAFVIKGFKISEKSIPVELASTIVSLMQSHPYYVQQLAYLTWINTKNEATREVLDIAVDELMSQNALLYMREVDGLSNTQVNLLKAISDGVQELTAASVLQQYLIGTSANVVKIKEALEKKEIIDVSSEKVVFIDPAFELWFRKNYYLGQKKL